jgi:hypothetical protein
MSKYQVIVLQESHAVKEGELQGQSLHEQAQKCGARWQAVHACACQRCHSCVHGAASAHRRGPRIISADAHMHAINVHAHRARHQLVLMLGREKLASRKAADGEMQPGLRRNKDSVQARLRAVSMSRSARPHARRTSRGPARWHVREQEARLRCDGLVVVEGAIAKQYQPARATPAAILRGGDVRRVQVLHIS